MKDAKTTAGFVQALNRSLESGSLMCQLYNAELNKYLMNLTNAFCHNQVELGVPRVQYVKRATECLGQQPGSRIWVMNEEVHLDEDGQRIPVSDSEYIWLGAMITESCLPNVAPAADAAVIPLASPPKATLNRTLSSLQKAVDNNYIPAFFVIASAGMAVHYQTIMDKYGMCPTPVAIGCKNTGKSTAARTALALLGTPQFFIREFSSVQTSMLSSRKSFPTVFDDPGELSKVKTLIDNTFNAGARTTARSTTVSCSTGIITLNYDRMKQLQASSPSIMTA